jgi:hypothetical protein
VFILSRTLNTVKISHSFTQNVTERGIVPSDDDVAGELDATSTGVVK